MKPLGRITLAAGVLAFLLLAAAVYAAAGPFQAYLPFIHKAPPPVVVVGAGDIADCSQPWTAATATLLTQIPGTVITLGDNPYLTGSAAEFNDCYNPTWGQVKARTRPAVGNHEYVNPDAAAYFAYFGAAAGDPAKGYYSYDLTGWHVVVLNSECANISGGCGAGSPEEQWLRADLAAHPAACTLAYWHQARFSSGLHGDHPAYIPFWQALYDAHATLVLNGHDHDYERFAPQDPQGRLDVAHGLREFVVGTGGRAATELAATRQPNSEISHDHVYGVIKLTLYPGRYHWDFVPAPGINFQDSGDGVCPGA